MAGSRHMVLGWMIDAAGTHAAGWQTFAGQRDPVTDIGFFAQMARDAEDAKLDFIFQYDSPSIRPGPIDAVARNSTHANLLEPFTQMAALSQHTTRIGLVATGSTTYYEPFNMARMVASLDHISQGRAGWNIVTGRHPLAAFNFGHSQGVGHAERYERGREFTEVVLGLWDSYDDDAFCRDPQTGLYFDPAKMHILDHKGKYYSVRGPLNMARSPQGWPVLFQAGASGDGRDFGARFGEVIFSINGTLEKSLEFYEDVKGRMAAHGRARDDMRVLNALSLIVKDSKQEAVDAYEEMQNLLHPRAIKHQVSNDLETDLMHLDLDDYVTVEDLPKEANSSKSADALLREWLTKKPMTVRELYREFSQSRSANTIYGTPKEVADLMEEWFLAGAADGFMMFFPLASGMRDFGSRVVPELQRRGLFRTDYEGMTLRDHLGLRRP